MGVIRITRIGVETLCHATEDEEKVLSALHQLVPDIESKKMAGHFGNPILMFSGDVTKKKDIESFMKTIRQKVLSHDIDFVRCTDEEGPLYLRFDKQQLALGRFVLKDDGEVKVTIGIQAYPHRKAEVVDNARKVYSGV